MRTSSHHRFAISSRGLLFGFVLWLSLPKAGRGEDTITLKAQ